MGTGEKSILTQALRGVSLTINEGEFTSIIGQSGSGKSTLMHILGFLDTPTSGSYFFDGKDTSNFNEDELSDIRSQKIGFVFQAFNLLPRTSATDNVRLPLIYQGVKISEQKDRAIEALLKVGLGERLEHKPNELSGGQQQRVAIARALVTNPRLILADEPTGNLDTKASEEIIQLFQLLNKEGKTIILVTHDPEVADISKRIIQLKDGQVISDRTKEQYTHVNIGTREAPKQEISQSVIEKEAPPIENTESSGIFPEEFKPIEETQWKI